MYISDKPGWETIHALANSSKGSFSCIKPQTVTEKCVCKGHSHGRTPSDGGGGHYHWRTHLLHHHQRAPALSGPIEMICVPTFYPKPFKVIQAKFI